jgi:hypothetical protein
MVLPGGVAMRFLLTTVLAVAIAAPCQAQLAPPNKAGITYGHVHVRVKDIEVHKKLWVDHFGGVLVQKGPLTAVRLPNMLIAFLGLKIAYITDPAGVYIELTEGYDQY